jgi:sugar/nucleoside kinase (ribokinase family)
MKSIVGFGALNLDLIFEVRDLKSISSKRSRLEPGKEGFGSDEEFDSLLDQLKQFGTMKSKSGGGSAANTIVALARMGFPTKFIGKVGEDEEGDFLLENLKPAQIDTIRRGQKSGVCLVILDRHQD